MFKKPFWIDDEVEFKHIKIFSEGVRILNEKFKNHPCMIDYIKDSAIMFIYGSNLLENTLTTGISVSDTYSILKEVLDDTYTSKDDSKWDADGRCYKQQQMIQHMKAYKYLSEQKDLELTVEHVLKTHEILMKNSIDKSKKSILNGKFREHPVYAGTHTFPPAQIIPGALNVIINNYNRAWKEEEEDPIKVAMDLFYDVVSLHPFQDGNGRLCRLLASHAFLQTGASSFPVLLTTKHRRSPETLYASCSKEIYQFVVVIFIIRRFFSKCLG